MTNDSSLKSVTDWSSAIVSEPSGLDGATTCFTITENIPTILSLDPAQDFELNTNLVTNYKIIFQNSTRENLGECEYFRMLEYLSPYTISIQNGSVLISALSSDDIRNIIAQTIFE